MNTIKPDCPLIGQNGNIYNLVGIASETLKCNGLKEQASEMTKKVFQSHSYEEALSVISQYVNVTSIDDDEGDEYYDDDEEGEYYEEGECYEDDDEEGFIDN